MPEDERFFENKSEAGKKLAEQLDKYSGQHHLYVIGLSPDAVPIAYEIAQRLSAPLTVLNTRELRMPEPDQIVFGAITHGGMRLLNQEVIDQHQITQSSLESLISREGEALEEQQQMLLNGAPFPGLSGRTLILVDDGMGAHEKMSLAAMRLRDENPQRIVAALPVGDSQSCAVLETRVDELVCLHQVESFQQAGTYYRKYRPTKDEQVMELLRKSDLNKEEAHDG